MSAILGTSVTGSTGAYTIDNSLRLRSSASAYFNRLPSVAGNRQKWTWSAWLKLGSTSSSNKIFATYTDANNQDRIIFGNGSLLFATSVGGVQYTVASNATYRDPSAWYHVVVAVDTTQATAANRMILYVNGSAVTLNGPSYPPQNTNLNINNTVQHYISGHSGTSEFYDGYIAELNFIDGQQLTPSSFGATNASTGVWQPAKYTGTYGTNGFYQKYDSIGATSSGTGNTGYGKDSSGNGNWYGTNNISSTAGVTYDAMTDSPTPKSSTVGNFCTLNPLDKGNSNMAVSNANLTFLKSGAGFAPMRGTLSVTSGKYYFEMTANTSALTNIGVCNDYNIYQNGGDSSIAYTGGIGAAWDSRGYLYRTGGSDAYAYTFTTNDVVMVAVDASSGKIWFGKNGTWNASGDPAAGTNAAYTAASYNYLTPYVNGESGGGGSVNFGQRPFVYTPPSGFNRLETYNLPTPTIGASSTTLAGKYFNAVLYSGNGTTNTVTGLGFQPDFLWFKNRNGTGNHALNDTNRGITKRLISDTTNVEDTVTSISSVNSDGFVLTGNDGSYNYNVGPRTYVTWCWKANTGTNSTNTNGSITSTVQANTTSGFSIVTYTGTGVTATVGHGLGVAPSMIIIKNRSVAGNWPIYHASLGNTVGVYLNLTNGAGTTDGFWNNTSPTSTVFTVKDLAASNGSGNSIVAYCFAEKTGFSKFGSYTGNGSSDGPFVYCGFRPKYILVKRTDAAGYYWIVHDTVRNTYNLMDLDLYPNAADSEGTSSARGIDSLSNGFKLRGAGTETNTSGGNYIYMAFAETPFNYSLAR